MTARKRKPAKAPRKHEPPGKKEKSMEVLDCWLNIRFNSTLRDVANQKAWGSEPQLNLSGLIRKWTRQFISDDEPRQSRQSIGGNMDFVGFYIFDTEGEDWLQEDKRTFGPSFALAAEFHDKDSANECLTGLAHGAERDPVVMGIVS